MKKHKKNDKKHSNKKSAKKLSPEARKSLQDHLFNEKRVARMVELANRWMKRGGDIAEYVSKIKPLLPKGAKVEEGSEKPFGIRFILDRFRVFYGLSGKSFLVWKAERVS